MRGFEAGLCRPLTQRLMLGGVPSQVGVALFVLAMEAMMLRLYVVLPFVLLLFWALRQLYKRDAWALYHALTQVRIVLYGRARLEV